MNFGDDLPEDVVLEFRVKITKINRTLIVLLRSSLKLRFALSNDYTMKQRSCATFTEISTLMVSLKATLPQSLVLITKSY